MASTDDVTERRFKQILAAALDEARPNRYAVSEATEEEEDSAPEHEDMDWIDRVADEHADILPAESVKRIHARTIARNIESQNLRRGNRVIRELYESDQLPLGWLETMNYPVTVIRRSINKGGRPVLFRERVRVGVLRAIDFRNMEAEERRAASKDFATRNRTADAELGIADEMESSGLLFFNEWLELKDSKGKAAEG